MRIYTAFPVKQADVYRMLVRSGVDSGMVPAAHMTIDNRPDPIPGSSIEIGGHFKNEVVLFTSLSVHLRGGGRVGAKPITGRRVLSELNQQGWEREDLRNATTAQKYLWLAALLEIARAKCPPGVGLDAVIRLDGPHDPLLKGAALTPNGDRFPDSYTMFHTLTGGLYRPEHWTNHNPKK